MAPIAEATWPSILRQTARDLAPFPGRLALAWRVALLCAIVTGAGMLYEIPEAAISCYLVIFLMRADATESIGQAIGVIGLATIVVALMVPLINATLDSAFTRLVLIAGASFVMLYLSSATTLGENAAIVGLIIAFILTLVSDVPAGIVATEGLQYAWEMAVMPMALMIAFSLVLGRGPQGLAADAIAERLRTAAETLEEPADDERLANLVYEGNADVPKKAFVARVLHLAPTYRTRWLAGAGVSSYHLLVAAAALTARPPEDTVEARNRLAAACRAAARQVEEGRVPGRPQRVEAPTSPAEAAVWEALEGLAAADGGAKANVPLQPAVAPDALSSPHHVRFALKTTAAAVICYLIYTGIGWSGIHTALVTCYVASLGTTGETVHKLALRITGCLVGAAMGVVSILYVIPQLDSIGGLMVLVFAGTLFAAWISSGPERVAYGGVQVALAFLLTILVGFGPSTDMSNAGDRIAGILLGNTVVYLIFTGIWPRSVTAAVRADLADALESLARVAGARPEAQSSSTNDVAAAAAALGAARETLFMLPFEPRRQQPPREEIDRLLELANTIAALLPVVAVSREDLAPLATRLAGAAAAVRAEGKGGRTIGTIDADDPSSGGERLTDLPGPMARLGALVAR